MYCFISNELNNLKMIKKIIKYLLFIPGALIGLIFMMIGIIFIGFLFTGEVILQFLDII